MFNKVSKIVLGIIGTVFVVLGIIAVIGALRLEIETSIHEIIQSLIILCSCVIGCTGFIMLTILAAAVPPSKGVTELPVYDMAEINKKLKEEKETEK